MTVGNKWLQYLAALSLSLPVAAQASTLSQPTAVKPVVVSAAASAKLRRYADVSRAPTVTPYAQGGPWLRVTWVQEWERFYQNSGTAQAPQAPLEHVPSLTALLDDVNKTA
jgi:hypothetical protein